jgi:hypothetical protein
VARSQASNRYSDDRSMSPLSPSLPPQRLYRALPHTSGM